MLWLRKIALRVADRISPEQIDRILDRLDFDSLCYERLYNSRRKSRRYTHRSRGVALSVPEDGQSSTLIASTRDLSAGGLGFLYNHALQPGTACTVRLLDRQRQAHVMGAKVAHCRPVQARLFEVGVQFDQPIDPALFLSGGEPADDQGE